MPEARPRELDVSLTSCTLLEALTGVPEASARPLVPEPFALAADGGVVLAAFGGAACAEGGRSFLALHVDPSESALLDPSVTRYFFEPEHATTSEGALTSALASVGAPAPSLDRLEVTSTPTGATLRATLADGTHRLDVASGGATGDYPEREVFREYFAAPGGFGYFQARFGASASFVGAPGTLETAPGTPARAALGASGAAAVVVIAGLTFEGASVGFIPYP